MYSNVAESLTGHVSVQWWERLGDLLHGRPGWHCDLTSEGLLWSYGALGASLFNISAPEDSEDFKRGRYEVFDFDEDESHTFTLDELRSWLEDNEHRHSDHAHRLGQLYGGEDWSILNGMIFDARVTHDGAMFVGTVPSLVLEFTAADDLATVVDNLRGLVTSALGAPSDVAPRVQIDARLDGKATRALSGPAPLG